jgi:hypothetical protein
MKGDLKVGSPSAVLLKPAAYDGRLAFKRDS